MASSKLQGTEPQQSPTNADLGTLAFQDSNAVKITGGDVTANHYVDTAISEVKPSLLLDFANGKTLDPRITFTRSTTATYYDGRTTAMAEQNLATYSQQLNNTNWSVAQANWIQNATTAPDGTATASLLYESSSTSEHYTAKSIGPSGVTAIFTTSVYAKTCGRQWLILNNNQSTGSTECWFDLINGTVGTVGSGMTATITSVGNGWYRCVAWGSVSSGWQPGVQLYLASTNGAATYAGDGASGVYCWGIQYEQRSGASAYVPTTSSPVTNYIPALQTCPANSARFDHDPITGESKGLLIEEQRTNLLTYSEQFDNAPWGKSANTTVTANQNISPDGTLSADKITPTAATSGTIQVYSTQSKSSSAIAYTGSFYVKAPAGYYFHLYVDANTTSNSGRIIFNTSDWSITSSTNFGTFTGAVGTVTAVGNGWYRISCSVTSGTETSIRVNLYLSNAVNTVTWTPTLDNYFYIWGAQLEAGSFPTSYIPTVASQVTRSADSASMTGSNFSSWYRADEGTVYSQFQNNASTGNRFVVNLSDGTANNRISTYNNGTPTLLWMQVLKAGTTQASLYNAATPSPVTGSTQYVVGTYKTNDFAATLNGATVGTDTDGSIPSVTQMEIGNLIGASQFLNGTIKKLAYYPIRLSNAELQEMTLS